VLGAADGHGVVRLKDGQVAELASTGPRTFYSLAELKDGGYTVAELKAGCYTVIELMKGFAANPNGDPQFWTPAPLLAKLAADGKSFT
jgi:hypothetical protein